MANEDLHPILKKLHETVGTIAKKVDKLTGEVKKIRTSITKQTETLVETINDNAQAQIEIKMMERVAEVKEIQPQISAEQERVEAEQDELERQLERISERYERKHQKLDEKAAERIRDLGEHIFEIDEDEFEAGIEKPFVEHVTAAWQDFQSQNQITKQQRQDDIESTAGDVVSEIHTFVERQNKLADRIQQVRTDIDPPRSKPTTFQIPYYVVNTETDHGTEKRVVVPSQANRSDGPVAYSFDPLPGINQLVDSSHPHRSDTKDEKLVDNSTIVNSIRPYMQDDTPLLSYEDTVEQAIDNRVSVAIEESSE